MFEPFLGEVKKAFAMAWLQDWSAIYHFVFQHSNGYGRSEIGDFLMRMDGDAIKDHRTFMLVSLDQLPLVVSRIR